MDRPTDPDGIDSHDTYAHFGLAMYAAQCVERQIVILAPMLLGMHPATTSRGQLDQLWERMSAQTMGRTLRELERSAGLPHGFEDRLKRALAVRNWLAHEYFWDRAADFLTAEGRQRMRDELSQAATFLHDLDAELVQIGHAWREGVGVTDEVLDAEMRKMLSGSGATPGVDE